MTALMEVERARADYLKESGKYVSIVIDGGVSDAGEYDHCTKYCRCRYDGRIF